MSVARRIVSLLPAATDWLVAFGAADLLVGRTHLCDASEATDARIVTRSRIDLGETAPDVDGVLRQAVQDGLSPFALDLNALRDLRPDLVITQAVCGVGAPPFSEVMTALASLTHPAPEILDFAPRTHKQVLDAALGLGQRIQRFEQAMRVVAESEQRLRALADRVGGRRQLDAAPTVVCVEWVEPPMTAGHWTPDLVEHAGGCPLLSISGEPSRYVSWDDVAEADPDVLLVAACGRSVHQSVADLSARVSNNRSAPDNWRSLRAVRTGRAFVLDGDPLFNRPGPSLARAAEVLAWALWGEDSGIAVYAEEAVPFSRVSVLGTFASA